MSETLSDNLFRKGSDPDLSVTFVICVPWNTFVLFILIIKMNNKFTTIHVIRSFRMIDSST